MKRLIVVLLAFVISIQSHAQIFEFHKNGKLVKKLTQKEIEKIAPAQDITLTEPHLKKELTFKASEFKKLLNHIYGETWTAGKTLVATCADGYQPVLKVQSLTSGTPYMAFSIQGTDKFEITKNGSPTPLGPAYLVWSDKLEPAKLQAHLSAGNWPYQVVKFNLN